MTEENKRENIIVVFHGLRKGLDQLENRLCRQTFVVRGHADEDQLYQGVMDNEHYK